MVARAALPWASLLLLVSFALVPAAACAPVVGADFGDWRASSPDRGSTTDPGAPLPDGGTAPGTDADVPPDTADGAALDAKPENDGSSTGCGPQTCAGCCTNGQCVDGRAKNACGEKGLICALCAASEICFGQACTPAAIGCGEAPAVGDPDKTCAKICQSYGKLCTPGCFNDPKTVGRVSDEALCKGTLGQSIDGCNVAVELLGGESLACCCV
jgi:hypothetical protein